jgi:phosphatidylglycerophosphatase A
MGYLITMLWLPKTSLFIILGFFLFRFFDIAKPPPIRLLERVKGGYGVVLDDVLAGVYANIVLQIVRFLIKSPLS